MTRYDHSSSNITALAVILATASIISVLLRILARSRSKAHLGVDDVFAVIALCGSLAYLGLITWESYNGLYYENNVLPPSVLKTDLKALYISGTIVPLAPMAARFSLLFLYNRIFHSDRSFSIAMKILGTLNALWYLGFTVAACLLCVPPKKLWNPLIKGQCVNEFAFIVAVTVPDALLDFSIMILPISILKRLQMSMRHKINLAMIFAIGGFVGLVGFVRVAITYRPRAMSLYESDIWLCIQIGFTVICCCLPTYGPILPKEDIFVLPKRLYSKLAIKIRVSATKGATCEEGSVSRKIIGIKSPIRRYDNLSDGGADGVVLTHTVAGSKSAEQFVAGRDVPLSAISTKSTLEMV